MRASKVLGTLGYVARSSLPPRCTSGLRICDPLFSAFLVLGLQALTTTPSIYGVLGNQLRALHTLSNTSLTEKPWTLEYILIS